MNANERTNDETFSDALEAHWKSIFQLGLRMFGNEADAEEAAQQTFFQAYQKWDQFEGRSQDKTWLFRIALNVCRKQLQDRGRFRTVTLDSDHHPTSPMSKMETNELSETVKSAFGQLASKHQLILTLFCIDGLQHAEISEILGVP
ncbi:MAG: sigma-70 family RNA polymerase sigma factor [Planctomycetota bacterium]